ncbi:MAG TPA: hypothetical protein H9740_01845 [Candidatus Hungatella pullicola]|nr:hypothetical protein [Candidatus Hungatella pullicola]
MNSLLLIVLSATISATIMFLEILILEKMSKGRANRILLFLMKMTTVFYLVPVISLAGILWPVIHQATHEIRGDDFKWINIGYEQLLDIPQFEQLTFWILIIWIIGVCINAYSIFIKSRRTLKKVLSRCQKADKREIDFKDEIVSQNKICKTVDVLKLEDVDSPFLTGISQPKIILPDTSSLTDTELKMAIYHEVIHLKNRDILFKNIAATVKCINWFNPIIHIYINRVYDYCEYTCDAEVTQSLDKEERAEYAKMIVSFASSHLIYEPVMMLTNSSKKEIERRVYQIMKPWRRKPSKYLIVVATGIVALCPITAYASVMGVKNVHEKSIEYYQSAQVDNKTWDMAIESEATSSSDADEIVLNFAQRGINNVDVVIGKGEVATFSDVSLSKGQEISSSLMADNSSDSFTLTIMNSAGRGVSYSSKKGIISSIYTVPNDADYTVQIKNNSGSSIHITGTIRIE